MMPALTSMRSWVWLAPGDRVNVVLMNSAVRSEKSLDRAMMSPLSPSEMSIDGECPHRPPQTGGLVAWRCARVLQCGEPGRSSRSVGHTTTMPVGAVPAGRRVGEIGSSVTSPPLTAKPLTTSPRPPVTNRNLPSGESRASAAPAPLVNWAVVPMSDSDPSRPMAYRERLPDPVLTANKYLPSWLISTQHGAVCPSGTGESPIERRTPRWLTWKADTVPRPAPLCALLTYSSDGLVGRNSAPIWPSPWPANGEPGAGTSRPFGRTVKLSMREGLSRVPTSRSPVELNSTSPTPDPSRTGTVVPGSGISRPAGVRKNPV